MIVVERKKNGGLKDDVAVLNIEVEHFFLVYWISTILLGKILF
jgi:hypothetical protein